MLESTDEPQYRIASPLPSGYQVVLLTLDHKVLSENFARGRVQLMTLLYITAQSISLSPLYRLDTA